jgi:hypothetical protein
MISYMRRAVGPLTLAALPLLSVPALASTPQTSSVIAMLGLSAQQIAPSELRNIRGGFDLSPSLSISFAFKQIESINGIVVQTIAVPETTVTNLSSGTKMDSSEVPAVTKTTSPAVTTASVSSPSVTVTNAAGATQTVNVPANSNINLTAAANNGLTAINTQLSNSGLTNTTMNQANNTAVSVAATMDISISGLSQFLAQQQSFANPQSGLYYGSAFR